MWRTYYRLRYPRQRGGFVIKKRKFFLENYRYFGRRILMQLEPPVVMPYVFARIDRLIASKIYDKIFFTSRVENPHCIYLNNYYSHLNRIRPSPYFSSPKSKFLTMVNANILPHTLRAELYGERLKAIRFFSKTGDFDLYGFRWDSFPRHPLYFHYGKYVRKVWRGAIPDKLKTMSEYKFALCFENCIAPGWISEKIFDCMAAGAIPVYYGAPDIENIVPKECFIDFRDFMDYDKLHSYLKNLSEEKLISYRERIAKFLTIPPNMSKLEDFVDKVLNYN